jgi:alpha-glucosidase
MSNPPSESAPPAGREWWRGAVVYQVYPRSFADTNGDGVGDLPGVTAHLDHIASLGVDGIWLSPFFTSPMKDFGYDVADYTGVDPIFGTLDDFDALIARAHALGLKVVIDQVYAHTSDAHAWFQESRRDRINAKADWYVWADAKADGSPPSNWQSVFGGPAWTWDARRGQYYMHNFLASQPQLNVRLPAVQDALLDAARFWLDRGVDGFRCDALNFAMHDPALTDNPPAMDAARRTRPFDFQQHIHNQSQPEMLGFLTRLRALTDSYDGDRFMVAEVVGAQSNAEMKQYTQGSDRLQTAYGFLYLYADRLNPDLVRQGPAQWPGAPGEGWPSWSFSNHDAPRAVSRWAEGRDPKAFAEMALLLLLALRGTIFLYQGEELGLPQAEVPFERLVDPEAIANWPETLGRDGARTPMPWTGDEFAGFSTVEPWLPVDPRHRALAVALQEADPASTLHQTRRMLGLRRAHPALRLGAMTLLDSVGDLLLFERAFEEETLLCIFNLGHAPLDWSPPAGWSVIEAVNAEGAASGRLAPLAGLILSRTT